ncbi:tetratricopeptide repeat protein [Micromonospora rosaria]|uniref:tetratricopeptide repeat protein n=3 Tax=Micromonospora rosaria TaxID=47874 RepID=UPI0037CC5D87
MAEPPAALRSFADRLGALRIAAGAPSYGRLARLHGELKTSTISDVLTARSKPSLDFVIAFVDACGRYAARHGHRLDPALLDADRWRADWQALRRALDARGTPRQPARDGGPPSSPAPAAEAALVVSNLPRRPAPAFLGRDDELRSLAGQLDEHPGIVIGQAVHGLGGIGKSELALQYAHRYRRQHPVVWWIRADTPANLTADLAALGPAVGLPDRRDGSLTDAADLAVRWLAAHRGWLLVLDNVTDPAEVTSLLARLGTGRVIATSQRDVDWAELGLAPLRLRPLSRRDSIGLLRARSGRDDDPTQAEALAADVGDLPLALRQAAAYLRERPHVGIVEYRRRLAAQPRRILASGVAPGADHPVMRTWGVTIDAIREKDPLAVRLLDTLAYLAPDRVDLALLAVPGRHPMDVEDAVVLAASYSMVNRQGDTISVHRLVQTVIRATHRDCGPLALVVDLLHRAAPAGEPETDLASWPLWNRLAAHVDAVATCFAPPGDDTAGAENGPRPPRTAALDLRAATVFERCAVYRRGQGQHSPAGRLFTLAHALRERHLGPEHPDTVTARYGLAGASWSAGRYQEAIVLGEQTLAARRRILGPDHPDTLSNASNVAIGYREVGRLSEAIALSERTLRVRRRVCGPAHPDTLQSQNNLAGCYRAAGRHDEALALYESTLAGREATLGAEHPDTLQSRNNLAGGYASVGRHADAIRLHEATAAARVRLLGAEHPDSLTSRHNLAGCYRATGRIAEAVALYERVLAAREQVLGPDHPDTRASRDLLTRSRAEAAAGTDPAAG